MFPQNLVHSATIVQVQRSCHPRGSETMTREAAAQTALCDCSYSESLQQPSLTFGLLLNTGNI